MGMNASRSTALAFSLLVAVTVPSALPSLSLAAETSSLHDEVRTVEKRIVALLLPRTGPARNSMLADAEKFASTVLADGSWPDIDYESKARSAWVTAGHFQRVFALAAAYRTPGHEGFGAEGLGAEGLGGMVHNALNFWLERDFQNPNWWWNEIGIPRAAGQVLLLLGEVATPAQIQKGIEILERSRWRKWTGQNLVWGVNNQILRGCLEKNPDVIGEAFQRMYEEIRFAKVGQEGIQRDFSFHQHGPLLYSGGYGHPFTCDCSRLIAVAAGTAFQVPDEAMRALEGHVLDGVQWMVRGRVYDYSVVGREVTRRGKSAISKNPGSWGYDLVTAVEHLAKIAGPRQKEFSNFLARLRRESGAPPLMGNRLFWRSDYMSHHRAGYATSVRMFSERTINAEFVNSEGGPTHHLADGLTYIYRTGEEYYDIFPVWDWKRLPGVTCEAGLEPLTGNTVRAKGKTDFVGGVSDGLYGLAAMDLARRDLTAKKSWFYFDDCFVCLGAGITCGTDAPVITSLNQCHLIGEVHTSAGGGPVPVGEHELEGISWVYHDGVGYVFPDAARVHLKNEVQTGSWSLIGTGSSDEVRASVFSLWLDHGARPAAGRYEYVVVPDCSVDEIALRAQRPGLRILANSPQRQTVYNNDLDLLQVAFWEPGEALLDDSRNPLRVEVDQPCLLMLRRSRDEVRLSISNPRNRPLTVMVKVNQRLRGPGCEPTDGAGTQIVFDLPGGDEAGRSVTRTLRIEG